eukprot:scaffold25812_cov36-Prasinocladus_malaysianus.AAC.1
MKWTKGKEVKRTKGKQSVINQVCVILAELSATPEPSLTCPVQKIVKREDGTVTSLEGELNPQGDFKKTKLKLTWLAGEADLVDLKLMDYGYLITKAKPEEDDNFEDL